MTKFYSLVKRFLPVLFLVSCYTMVLGQERAVSGKVTSSDDGSSVPGVNILEKGTNNGTVTDMDGNFKLNVGNNATLVFSFVGYATQEVSVGAQSVVNVSLQADVTALQEVVVVGYGEVKKQDATGAVVNMSNKDFNKGVIAAPQDLIVGKFAGVQVTSSGGAPGASSQIRVRGGSSLSANNDPLIVIDGYPVDNATPSGVANPLASLNPNDIETFTVLKDASATAIYGSRASNGVIIITTKKGVEGKPKVNYNGTVSVSSPIKNVDVLDGPAFTALVTKLAATTPPTSGIDAAAVAKLGTANTNWQNEIFRTAISQDHNINVSGSYKKLPYRVSYGYTDQQGILKTTSMQRNSINVNLNPTLLNGDLKLNISGKQSWVNNNFGEQTAVGAAVAFDPTQPIMDPAATQFGGYFSWLSKGSQEGRSISQSANPVAMLNQADNTSKSNRFIGSFQAEYRLPFLKELKAVINTGVDRTTSDGHYNLPTNAAHTSSFDGTGTIITVQGRKNLYAAKNQSELLDLYFNYVKEFGQHKVDLTGGYGWQHFYRENSNYDANAAETIVNQKVAFKSENFLVSFFGRLNYTYNGKYLLTATLRDDGSSRFSSKNRWGLFPSVALAWRMKEEGFLSNVNFLSDLKLRAGYGETGQQDITNNQYPYLATYRLSDAGSQYQFGNPTSTTNFYKTLRPDAYDPNIKWETTTTVNVGVDFGFFKNKITGSVEVYQKKTNDLINTIAIPAGVNFSNFLTTNVGNLENNGVEVTLRATPIETDNLTWNIGFNFTRNVSKITKLTLTDDPAFIGVSAGGIGVDAFIQNQQVGYPVNSFFVYQQVYDAAGKPIEGLYVDRSGQGGSVVGNNLNKYRFKSPIPDFLIGINTRLNYKKFDFSFSGRWSYGNYVYNNVASGRAFYNNTYNLLKFNNLPTQIDDTKFTVQQQYSDYYVQNGSFFKMDNIAVGYSFDEFFTSKLKARVSLTVQNAFIITSYKGLDPEIANGIDNNIYPRPRVFLVGLNITY